jgi:endonuclease YncB( thermonuclease family)
MRLLAAAVYGCGLLLTTCVDAGAAGCADGPVQGQGVVAAIMDARTLLLDDGREVRFAGLEPIAERHAEAIAALSKLLLGRAVTLHGADDGPDRYGRQPAFVAAEASASTVQAHLIAGGDALVGIGIANPECRTELRDAETIARRGGKGAWAGPGVIKNAANSGDILARIGRFTLVEGTVVSVREAGATVYLNFGRRWTRDFAVIISRRIVKSFEAAGITPKSLKGQRIRVRGWVAMRTGPMIAVRESGQIERTGGD